MFRLSFVKRFLSVTVIVLILIFLSNFSRIHQLTAIHTENQHWVLAPPTAKRSATRDALVGTVDSQDISLGAESIHDEPCRIPPSFGPEGSMGFQALTKIQPLPSVADQRPTTLPDLRLLCIIVTDSNHHPATLPAILETYAPSCDGVLVASNLTDLSLKAVGIPVDNSWDRLQKIWTLIQKEYIAYDAFHFGVESTYVLPDNLRRMLSSYAQFNNSQTPMYLGGAVVASRKVPEVRYCGGQAGYTLNRAALQLADRLSDCSFQDHDLPLDQKLAHCFKEIANLDCIKTVDNDSALRYIEFGLDYHAKFSRKYIKQTPIKVKPLAKHHGIYIRDGLQGIASDAVSFSIVNYGNNVSISGVGAGFTVAEALYRTHAILYGRCRPTWDDPPIIALDAKGNPGYIHDPDFVRHNPPTLTMHPEGDDLGVCETPFGSGIEGSAGYQGLQKIQISDDQERSDGKKKVLCMIYTHSGQHSTRLRPIAETYGPRCDGFLAASNQTDRTIGAVNIQHEGPEEYGNMWLKVRSMWKYAYQHYLDDYDFFHIGGDDHYLIPENLIYMADKGSVTGRWNDSGPLFLGGCMIDFPLTQYRYCGGGSGYTLNRVALKVLIEDLFDSYRCRPHYYASDEDRLISNCFRSIGIQCMNTNDGNDETRYHQAGVDFHASWTNDQPSVWNAAELTKSHGIASKERLGQISTSSVSFHLKLDAPTRVQDLGLRRYHAILHHLCPNETFPSGKRRQ